MFITAVKANKTCRNERQNLNILRSSPIGRYIEPEIAKDAAVSLVDCFQRLYQIHDLDINILLKPSGEKYPFNVSKAEIIVNVK